LKNIFEKVCSFKIRLYICINKNGKTMTTQEIKTALLEGQNFGNEAANWYSVCKPSENPAARCWQF
jgi:hypothetical protein